MRPDNYRCLAHTEFICWCHFEKVSVIFFLDGILKAVSFLLAHIHFYRCFVIFLQFEDDYRPEEASIRPI